MRALVVLLLLAGAGAARADVVMPPPEHCPPGQVPTTSHHGARCELAPPADCLAGWRGEIGGNCVLDVCTADASCREGKRCVPQELCFRPRTRHMRHSNMEEQYFRPEDVCSPSCQAPGECRPARVCLPAGASAAAAAPGRPASVAAPAPAPAPAPVALPPDRPMRCGYPGMQGLLLAGCAVVTAAVAVLVWLRVKRRRK